MTNISTLNLSDLTQASLTQLLEFGKKLGLEQLSTLPKQDIIIEIVKAYNQEEALVYASGILEVINTDSNKESYGFIRHAANNYLASADDIYVSPNQIRRFNLRTGDKVAGEIRPPKENAKDKDKTFALLKVLTINDQEAQMDRPYDRFENLTPIFPEEQLKLESSTINSPQNTSTRLIDLLAPIGKGQRALLVAPPKAGKTELLKQISLAIKANNPECELLVLLIDERPEEVTEMSRIIDGEVLASTFDMQAKNHINVAEMVLEKAKRIAEQKKDVVILLDSITRLARAYNFETPSSGRVLSGGLDAASLFKPKHFFGSARNLEEGGSLTIIATCLVETGSKMDEVIYEEFKGTGNMELHLDRRLAERRIYPAINILSSSTRKDDRLLPEASLEAQWLIRKAIHNPYSEQEALSKLIELITKSKTNEELLTSGKIEANFS